MKSKIVGYIVLSAIVYVLLRLVSPVAVSYYGVYWYVFMVVVIVIVSTAFILKAINSLKTDKYEDVVKKGKQ